MDLIEIPGFEHIDFTAVKPQLLFKERRDTKFLFHRDDLVEILESIKNHYLIVKHRGQIKQKYSTLYYDDSALNFYLSHHNGHANRIKKRIRTYEDGSSFFEIKRKVNTGDTLKERHPHAEEFTNGLKQQLEVVYERVTFYDKEFKEKLTLDFNLFFCDEHSQKRFSSIVIAESKKMKSSQSVFVEELKKRRVPSSSFSKYCIGMVSLKSCIKKNNFKNLIHKINKLNTKYESTTNVK